MHVNPSRTHTHTSVCNFYNGGACVVNIVQNKYPCMGTPETDKSNFCVTPRTRLRLPNSRGTRFHYCRIGRYMPMRSLYGHIIFMIVMRLYTCACGRRRVLARNVRHVSNSIRRKIE